MRDFFRILNLKIASLRGKYIKNPKPRRAVTEKKYWKQNLGVREMNCNFFY